MFRVQGLGYRCFCMGDGIVESVERGRGKQTMDREWVRECVKKEKKGPKP
jgi:hypothetical protein